MNRQKMISTIKQDFMLKRIRAEEKAEENISNLRQNPEFNKLYTEYYTKQLEYLKSKYDKELSSLKNEVQEIKNKIQILLKKSNMSFEDLSPKYECAICNDTGVVDGKICDCLLGELNKKLSISASSQATFKSFEDCNEGLMDETDKKAFKLLKTWCNSYPKITKLNFTIFGGAGSGKTFMLESVANEMIQNGHVVCYKTAFELNELARLYHIGKSYEFSDCMNADILFIDDLGTEPVLKNVTKEYLYNLINMRQIKKLPTFISTNLSLENIISRYDERIFSRLANKNLSVNISLTSNDKRINN